MKAITQDKYGPPEVLALADVDQPAVKDDQVLVRVHAAAIHPGDLFVMTGLPYVLRLGFGLRRPRSRVRGFDLAGTVVATGPNVTRLQVGDEVFGAGNGTLAEYAIARASNLAAKPANLTFEQAAAVPTSALTALHALRDHAKVKPGQRVLINGAAGGIGTFAVQIAKSYGAEVTGVCSTSNVDLVRSIGADHVIDYRNEDFTQNGQHYDAILDNVANHSLSDLRRSLTREGILLPNNGTSGGPWLGPLGSFVRAYLMSMFVRQVRPFVSTPNQDDLVVLKELLEAGTVTPVIGTTYPLSGAAEAFRQLQTGHARGKLVITV